MMSQTRAGGAKVPAIQCLTCGGDIVLEYATYDNYQGQVICPECKGQQAVVIKEGSLVTASQQQDVYEPIRDVVGHAIPQEILVDLAEAAIDLASHCFKSCVVMCRRSTQAVLLDKGVPDEPLAKMIDAARNSGLLDERLYQTARAIGFFGNSGAHPLDPELRKVEQLDATLALQVTKKLLQTIYPPEPESPGSTTITTPP